MTKKYEKFEEWMVGKTVLGDGDKGVVTREYEGVENCVWVEWEYLGMDEAWIEVESLTFLNIPRSDTQSQSNGTPIPWEVGQVVWDIVFGKGVVSRVEEDGTSPVKVALDDGGNESYTLQGSFYGAGTRTLFFSEPTIIADTMPPKKPFVPTLKEGEKILLKVPYLEEEKVVFVRREEENILYYMFEDGTKDYSGKSQITVTRVGEEIKWEN